MPNRTIKESALTSRTLDQLSDGAERLFWRLTVVADDYGRFDAAPTVVLARCFPLKVQTLKLQRLVGWLVEIVTVELVTLYRIEDRLYGYFLKWEKHQGEARAKTSKHPEPAKDTIVQADADICMHLFANVPVVGFRSRSIVVERSYTDNARARANENESDRPRPDPNVKVFLDYAFEAFQTHTGEKLCIDGKKDGAIVKRLLGTYGLDRLKGLWTTFLRSDDPFIRTAGRSIGVFKSQINKLLTEDHAPPRGMAAVAARERERRERGE